MYYTYDHYVAMIPPHHMVCGIFNITIQHHCFKDSLW